MLSSVFKVRKFAFKALTVKVKMLLISDDELV
jgi:hypothetical protein